LKEAHPKDHIVYDPAYSNHLSSASAYVSDIQSIIVGGVHSRFWMFRKHFNTLATNELEGDIAFYNWECITLRFNHRDVDLVIKDEH